jgi:hypothetical protein
MRRWCRVRSHASPQETAAERLSGEARRQKS